MTGQATTMARFLSLITRNLLFTIVIPGLGGVGCPGGS